MTKDELIDKYRDINVDDTWWDTTYDDFAERLGEAGIIVVRRDISFSGFWSQGDGAQFALSAHDVLGLVQDAQKWMLEQWPAYEGKGEDGADAGGPIIDALHDWCTALLEKLEVHLMDGELRAAMEATFLKINTHGTYCHSGEMRAEIEYDTGMYDVVDESLGIELEAMFQDSMRALADALYDTLEKEYDYLTEDEQVWETIEANGLDKTEDDEEEESCNA